MKIDRMEVDCFGDTDPKKMPAHLFSRAQYLDYATAQRAFISNQNYTVCPRYWYLEATYVCCDCSRAFVFSVSEQRYWYEELKLFVTVEPSRCNACRKARWTQLERQKRLNALIGDALDKRSSPGFKMQMVAVIDELEASEESISEDLTRKREILRKHLAQAT